MYLIAVIDCCTRALVAWHLSVRCRAEEAITPVEQAATTHRDPERRADTRHRQRLGLHRPPGRARHPPPTRRPSGDPESQAFIESWFGKPKEREMWPNEFETPDQARPGIADPLARYHHHPHPGPNYRTPHKAHRTREDQQQPQKQAASRVCWTTSVARAVPSCRATANRSAATTLSSANGSAGTTATPACGATAAITHPPPYRGTARNPGRPQPRRPPHRSPRTGAQPDYPSCCRDGNNGRSVSEPSPHVPEKRGHSKNRISRVHTGSRVASIPTNNLCAFLGYPPLGDRWGRVVPYGGLARAVGRRRPAAGQPTAGLPAAPAPEGPRCGACPTLAACELSGHLHRRAGLNDPSELRLGLAASPRAPRGPQLPSGRHGLLRPEARLRSRVRSPPTALQPARASQPEQPRWLTSLGSQPGAHLKLALRSMARAGRRPTPPVGLTPRGRRASLRAHAGLRAQPPTQAARLPHIAP